MTSISIDSNSKIFKNLNRIEEICDNDNIS